MMRILYLYGHLFAGKDLGLLTERAAVAEDLEKGRNSPRNDIQKIQRNNGAEERENRINPNYAEHARAQDHDHRGAYGFAKAAAGGDGAVHKS